MRLPFRRSGRYEVTVRNVLKPIAIAAALALAAPAYAQPPAPSPLPATPAPAHPSPEAATPGAAAAAGTFKPGLIISAENAKEFDRYLPEAAKFALAHGFRMRITPQRRINWSEGFQKMTEKYSGQVGLDAHDYIMNYVAGMPFPLIDVTDPKAAVKIAYNWHMGPVMPDDFSLAPWSSNGYKVDPNDSQRILAYSDKDYACDEFDFLRFSHRTEVDPRPTLGENGMGVEWKAKCNKWIADATGTGTNEGAGIWVRYNDPQHPDEFFSFSEMSRRVRRTAVNLAYPNEFCRGCHQPYWAYALPKTENYTYRLLGTTTILACMAADDEPAGIKPSTNGYVLSEEPFEPRHAYIIEMTPKVPEQAEPGLRTILFIDSEIYVWLAAEFYDIGGRTSVAMPLWRMRPSAEGGNLFDLAGSFYVPAAGGLFRSLVPAHATDFKQLINTNQFGESAFLPQALMR